jgi:hypothetical protein
MSWEEARRDAELWIDRLQLKRPGKGETIDLRPFSASLQAQGRYRSMVINAIRQDYEGEAMERHPAGVMISSFMVARPR